MLLLSWPEDVDSPGVGFSRQFYFALAAGYGWLVGNLVRARARSRIQASGPIVLEALSAAGILLLALVLVVPEEREEEAWTFALALLVYATLFLVPFLFDRRH